MANSQQRSKAQTYADFNLVPLPANAVPLGGSFISTVPPTRPSSLTRLGELHKFLVQCDDPAYYNNYYQVRNTPEASHLLVTVDLPLTNFGSIPHLQLLNSSTPDMLQDALRSLKERSQWLDSQQNIEFTRMRSLNILPLAISNVVNTITGSAPPAAVPVINAYINTTINPSNHKKGSATPEIRAGPTLPAAETAAALAQHQLIRDSVTPPSLASFDTETDAKGTKGRKKGPIKQQAKLKKRKRT
jgi:hypothetical protein